MTRIFIKDANRFLRQLRVLVRAQESACASLTGGDRFEMCRLIYETNERGRELGFVKCDDGSYKRCSGNECHISLFGCRAEDKAPVLDFHTHPTRDFNDIFSIGDISTAASSSAPVSCLGYMNTGDHLPHIKCVSREKVNKEQLRESSFAFNVLDDALAEGYHGLLEKGFTEQQLEPLERAGKKYIRSVLELLQRVSGVCDEVARPELLESR